MPAQGRVKVSKQARKVRQQTRQACGTRTSLKVRGSPASVPAAPFAAAAGGGCSCVASSAVNEAPISASSSSGWTAARAPCRGVANASQHKRPGEHKRLGLDSARTCAATAHATAASRLRRLTADSCRHISTCSNAPRARLALLSKFVPTSMPVPAIPPCSAPDPKCRILEIV